MRLGIRVRIYLTLKLPHAIFTLLNQKGTSKGACN